VPSVEIYAVEDSNYPFRSVRIDKDGRRSIWCTDLPQALEYLPMLGRARIHLIAPGTWEAALLVEETSALAPL